jgi:uncharacterized protein (DUF305 family)
MAIGEVEAKFLEDMAKHHAAGAKLAEGYLSKSDTASRPASVVSMAAGMISDHAYQVERLEHMKEYLEKPPNASKEAAARLMGGYEY